MVKLGLLYLQSMIGSLNDKIKQMALIINK